MTNLPQQTIDRITSDALAWSESQYGHDEPNKDYIEGALHEAGRASGLVDALKAVKRKLNILENDDAIEIIDNALAKYMEVGNG